MKILKDKKFTSRLVSSLSIFAVILSLSVSGAFGGFWRTLDNLTSNGVSTPEAFQYGYGYGDNTWGYGYGYGYGYGDFDAGYGASCGTVSNGSYSSYPACKLTCNTGYKVSGSTCVKSTSSSGGGSGSSKTNTTNTTGNDSSLSNVVTTIKEAITTALVKAGSVLFTDIKVVGEYKMANITTTGTLTLKTTETSKMYVTIPSGVTVAGSKAWDGKISAPVLVDNSVVAKAGALLVKVGSDLSRLTFNKEVDLVIPTSYKDGQSFDVYTSHDGKKYAKEFSGVVANGVASFKTTHFSYFMITPVLASTTTKTEPTVSNVTFKDVTGGYSVFAEYISKLAAKGVVKGYEDGTFRPGNNASRAEFLKMALLALGHSYEGTDTSKLTYADVNKTTWQAQVIAKAVELNIVSTENKNFRPNDNISRAEALKILIGAAGVKVSETTTSSFADVTVAWMKPYTETAKNLGIVSGQMVNGKLVFRPTASITRAEVAKIVVETTELK